MNFINKKSDMFGISSIFPKNSSTNSEYKPKYEKRVLQSLHQVENIEGKTFKSTKEFFDYFSK